MKVKYTQYEMPGVDPTWSLYRSEGPTLQEILATKPSRLQTQIDQECDGPGKACERCINGCPLNVWTQEKGWHRDETTRYSRSYGRNRRKVPKQRRKPAI